MATRIASVCVAGLKTAAKWVDHFVIELYSDSGYVNRLSTQTANAIWDGTYSTQQNPIFFSGLTYGQTYYFRGGVVSPITNQVSWTECSVVAGSNAAPTTTFEITYDISPSGAHVIMTPVSVPPDLDHYEATWNYDGATPAATDVPKWSGHITPNQVYFEIWIGAPRGETVYLFIRSVNTTHIAQAWTGVGVLSVAQIDPTHPSFKSLGSIPPSVVSGMAYASNESIIDWFWDGENGSSLIDIYRADGTVTTVPASRVGVNSLAASTVYYFYPYYKEISAGGPGVGFAAGGVGNNDPIVNSTGGAGIAQTSRNLPAAAAQNLQGHVGLAIGGMAAQTGGSSTTTTGGGGGSGGGGGGGGCPRRGMVVQTRDRGLQPVESLSVGEQLLTRDGEWTTITRIASTLEGTFIRLHVSNGETIDQGPETPMPLARGEKLTKNLCLSDVLIIRDGDKQKYGQLRAIEVVDEVDYKFAITCSPSHEFFCGQGSPTILTHNNISSK